MLQKRVIPCLLFHKRGLYKTEKFKKPTYIGDPINAIKIFNEKEVDELIFMDIDATIEKREPNFQIIEDIASECFMPLCYGGGVKNVEQMKKIFSLGVEKISLSSVLYENPGLIKEAVEVFGSQSVIVTIDYKKDFLGRNKVYINNGRKCTKQNIEEVVQYVESLGVGEIVINAIDKDGVMGGYDIDILKMIKKKVNIPVIALGGAGSLDDVKNVFELAKVDAAACGSLFVYQGPLKGVLINYPSYQFMRKLLGGLS